MIYDTTKLYNRVSLVPIHKAAEIAHAQTEKDQQALQNDWAANFAASDLMMQRHLIMEGAREDAVFGMGMGLKMMASGKVPEFLMKKFLNEFKDAPTSMWIEVIGQTLQAKDIMNLLDWYSDLLKPIIEVLIANLPAQQQTIALNKHAKHLNVGHPLFDALYWSVVDDAKKIINAQFPDSYQAKDIISELAMVPKENLLNQLFCRRAEIKPEHYEDIIELAMLHLTNEKDLLNFAIKFQDIIEKTTPIRMQLFLRNLIMIHKNDVYKPLNNLFKKIGLRETVYLFRDDGWATKEKQAARKKLIMDFIESSKGVDTKVLVEAWGENFVEDMIPEMRELLLQKYMAQQINIKDCAAFVRKLSNKPQLFEWDYIRAIAAMRQNFNNIKPTDKIFIDFKKKIIECVLKICPRDESFDGDVNLDGFIVRLIKGGVQPSDLFALNSFKALMLMTRTQVTGKDSVNITTNLTDKQITEFNTKQFSALRRIESKLDDRLKLQLLVYFGLDRAKHIIDSRTLQQNGAEFLFDALDYKNIPAHDSDLMQFLFGRGQISERQSVFNTMLRGEQEDFESHFSEVCNTWNDVKKKLNGLVSVKRIVNCMQDDMTIELRPDQAHYRRALREMKTKDIKILETACEWLDIASMREHSTIPYVCGNIGEYRYETLKIKDPLCAAVGYMSHCCFLINGQSKGALKYSLESSDCRTFVFYKNDAFLGQSWVWRNGDVVCFDSIESGSYRTNRADENIVKIYQSAAKQILEMSAKEESEESCVKLITVGNSDYTLPGLTNLDLSPVPRPIEANVYVYDSQYQKILGGTVPAKIKYGEVDVKYMDPRNRIQNFNNIDKLDIDDTSELLEKIHGLKFATTIPIAMRLNKEQRDLNKEKINVASSAIPNLTEYNRVILGQDWYIAKLINGGIESNIASKSKHAIKEYSDMLQQFGGGNGR